MEDRLVKSLSRIPALMTGVLIAAWLISARPGFWWIQPVLWLAQFEVFHIIMHWIIFGLLAYLIRTHPTPRFQPRRRWAWACVLLGGLALELAQVAGSALPLRALLRGAVAFDLVMDAFGGWIGLRWAARQNRRPVSKGGAYGRAHR